MNSQNVLTGIKLGVVAVAVAGVFTLAALGRISAGAAVSDVTIVVGSLLAALGLSAGGSAVGAAMMAKKE
jgi:hypothetical protein